MFGFVVISNRHSLRGSAKIFEPKSEGGETVYNSRRDPSALFSKAVNHNFSPISKEDVRFRRILTTGISILVLREFIN